MTNAQLFITLSFFISFNLALNSKIKRDNVVQGMFDHTKQKIFQPKECGENILKMYLKDTDTMRRSELASREIHTMCPNLVDTCCNLEQVTQIHQKMKQSFDNNSEILEHITNLVDQIANATQSQIDNIILKKQELEEEERQRQREYYSYSEDSQENSQSKSQSNQSEEKEPVETEEQQEFRQLMQYFKDNSDSIKENISLPYMAYNRFAARYGCTLCDSESQNAFRDVHSKTPKRQYDVAMCKSFYEDSDARLLGRMTYEMYQIERVFRFLGKINKDFKSTQIPNQLIEDEENVKLFELSINKCSENLNWKTNSECLQGCSNLKLLNGNYLSQFQGNLILYNMIAPFAFDLDMEFDLESNLQELRTFYQRVNVRFFIFPEGSFKPKLEALDFSYEYGTGWNIAKHSFIPNPLEVSDTENSFSPDDLLKGHKSKSEFVGKISTLALAIITFLLI